MTDQTWEETRAWAETFAAAIGGALSLLVAQMVFDAYERDLEVERYRFAGWIP